jgi:hypothetical protein
MTAADRIRRLIRELEVAMDAAPHVAGSQLLHAQGVKEGLTLALLEVGTADREARAARREQVLC